MSFRDWESTKLISMTEKIGSGSTPRGGSSVYSNKGIPFIRSQNIYNCMFSKDGMVFINEEQAKKLNNVEIFEDDILLNITGDSVARCTIVPKEYIGGRVNQHVAIIRTDKKKLEPKFLKYFLVSTDMQLWMLSLAQMGATRAALTKGMIESFEIPTPDLKEQKSIAHILSTLDEKIEVNNQINKTLEKMAQAIFKQWFVNFEFPNEEGEPYQSSGGEMAESELGMIPKGWEVGTIGDYVKVKSGYAFKSIWWKTEGIPVIKIKDIDNRTISFLDCSFVSEDKGENAKDYIVHGGEILIAMTGATIGKFAIVPKMQTDALVNQRVGKFFLGEKPIEKVSFLYCILNQNAIFTEIITRGDGSAQPNISPTGIESIKIVLPDIKLLNELNKLMCVHFEKIIENNYENTKLTVIRDMLLPKLMSGEIRVPLDSEGEAL